MGDGLCKKCKGLPHPSAQFSLILTSSTVDKKLEIYKNLEIELEIYKNLENFEFYFEIFVNFEFYFEIFVISSFLSVVDEVNITHYGLLRHITFTDTTKVKKMEVGFYRLKNVKSLKWLCLHSLKAGSSYCKNL